MGQWKGSRVGFLLSQQENHNKARQALIRRAVPMAAVAVQPTICRVSMAGFPRPARPALGMVQGAGTRRSCQLHPWSLPCWSTHSAQGDLCAFPLFYKLKTAECPYPYTIPSSSWGLSSNEPCFAYLLTCCLTVFHRLHQGSWEHVMSNISIFYCYATFYCFGLKKSWWILVCKDTYMRILACFLHSNIFDQNCHVFRWFIFCSVLVTGTPPEVRADSTFSYKSLI